MLLATTIELYDGLVAARPPRPGTARRRRRLRPLRRRAPPRRPAGGRRGTDRPDRRADRRPGGRPGRAGRRAVRGRRLAAGHRTTASTVPPRWTGCPAATAELAGYPDVLHLQRTTAFGTSTTASSWRSSGAPTTSAPPRRNTCRGNGSGASAPGTCSSPPGLTSGPSCSPTTTAPASCSPAAPAPSCTATACSPAARPSCSPPTTAPTPPRSTSPTPASRCAPSSTPGRNRPRRGGPACERRGIPVRAGAVVTGTEGAERVRAALVAPLRDGAPGEPERIACDLLLVSGGWNPAVHLFSQAGGTLRYDAALGAFVPDEAAGPARPSPGPRPGCSTSPGCLARRAGGRPRRPDDLGLAIRAGDRPARRGGRAPSAPRTLVLWRVPDAGADARSTEFVDLQRDATVADIARAIGAGLRSIEHIKRYTTIGTAHDQGKTSGVIASGIAAELLGRPIEELGTTTFRPPYTPVAFAALAGRNRGSLFDPERTTAVHAWHLAHGAVLEDVGQWKRPRYYPQPGRGHGGRRAAGVRGGPRRRRHPRRLHPGQDRRAGPRRRGVPRPALHEHDEQPEGRLRPLRRDVRGRRHGPRRRHRAAPRPTTGSWSTPPPAARPGSSTGWRTGCRPSGRTCGVHCHLGHRAVGDLPGRRPPVARRGRPR